VSRFPGVDCRRGGKKLVIETLRIVLPRPLYPKHIRPPGEHHHGAMRLTEPERIALSPSSRVMQV
jgi:hypothetical protein